MTAKQCVNEIVCRTTALIFDGHLIHTNSAKAFVSWEVLYASDELFMKIIEIGIVN